ncbi:hypothetical protein ACFCXS_15370 [Streptomyces sp. NPDC056373]|uniref:hypothetical protein n=1 Tax=Streptomyces sp. NPDC056373 TaxID=3345798 RepID=UPI0035D769A3
MSRPQHRAPKGRTLDRLDRRAVVDNLLARTHRARLTSAEAALLGDYVREERRQADENRRAMAGTTQALERHREAADAAIRELEQRAGQADALSQAAHQCSNEAEQHRAEAVQRLAAQQQMHEDRRRALADALAAPADTPWPQLVDRAQLRDQHARENSAEATDQYKRARRAEAALDRVRQADSLGAALAAVAEFDGLTPQAAAAHGALTDRADTTAARLAEQQREHEVALATERRTGERAVEAWQKRAREAEEEVAQQRARANGWRAHAIEADDRADRHLAAWRNARRRAREHAAEEERVRGWCAHWHDRADTFRAAWQSARDRARTRTEERDRALAHAAARGDALAAHLASTEAPR